MTACARRSSAHIPPAPFSPRVGSTMTGIASWYGAPYDGRRAASGEIYDMEQLTAAHQTLPFGTWVEVTNLANQKRVEVRINDRGPFVGGRVIDLSHAAAREIDMLRPGIAEVRLTVIAAPPRREIQAAAPKKSTGTLLYVVQAGAFSTSARASDFRTTLGEVFEDTHVVEPDTRSSLWRVLVGSHMTFEEAGQLAEKIREAGGEALVVTDLGTDQTAEPLRGNQQRIE
jgi:rare lipoprotein A